MLLPLKASLVWILSICAAWFVYHPELQAENNRPERPGRNIDSREQIVLTRKTRTLVFDCSGLELMVRNGPGEIALWFSGRYTVLGQVRSASGAKYAGDGIQFWNKGSEVLLEVDGVRYDICKRVPEREPWADAERRGVNFRATGNEPAWNLEVTEGRLLQMVTDYGQRTVRVPAADSISIQAGRKYHATTRTHDIAVEILDQPCQDTMSDEFFEASVTVRLDTITYHGCGRYLPIMPR